MLQAPELNTVFPVGPHEGRAEEENQHPVRIKDQKRQKKRFKVVLNMLRLSVLLKVKGNIF